MLQKLSIITLLAIFICGDRLLGQNCNIPVDDLNLANAVEDSQVAESFPQTQIINETFYNCLTHANNSNFYLFAGATIYFGTIAGNPTDFTRAVFACNNVNTWMKIGIPTQLVNIGTEPFRSSSFLRENCSTCSLPATGDEYLCVSCNESCLEVSSLNFCYGAASSQCCNYFFNTNCVLACPANTEANSSNICVCQHSWEGALCDQCSLNCANGTQNSECSMCNCDLGFSEMLCDTNIDDCSPNPCNNSGICMDLVNNYTCNCTNAWMGRNCSECGLDCVNGTVDSNCSICNCDLGFSGLLCDTNIDDCSPNPCNNSGACMDLVNNYTCNCTNSWMGRNCSECGLDCVNGTVDSNCSICNCDLGFSEMLCDTNIDDCSPNPCNNSGACMDLVNNYTCNCTNSWMGRNCSECGLDCVNGTVDSNCSICNCDLGFSEMLCDTNIDDCSPNPCNNSGTCMDLVNNYTCNCTNAWMGRNCSECGLDCVNGTVDSNCSICNCDLGFSEMLCDTNIDDCSPNPCNNSGTCMDLVNNYTCNCTNAWMGRNCSECGLDCVNGTVDSNCSICNCDLGFSEMHCDTNIDDCLPNPCNNSGACMDLVNNYTCNCTNSWMGRNCSECGLDCVNGTVDSNCSICNCDLGFSEMLCDTNIDDCLPNPCNNNGACTDLVNNYTCNCTNKWNGDNCTTCPLNCNNGTMTPNCTVCVCNGGYGGESCEIDINECEPDPCFNNATCIDQINGYTCNCTNKWNGDNCTTCPLNCNNGTITPNCTVCICNAGYEGDSCEIDINECEPDPCFNNATCIDQINGYTCNCTNKWNGDTCNICPLNCNNGTMTPNCTVCICNGGYGGESCEIDINECEPEPCFNNATCIDQINGYTCNCTNKWNGDNCTTCPLNCNNGTMTPNCTVCVCNGGYEGESCEIDINECEPDPCFNNATCIDQINGYTCNCTNKWNGDNCTTCPLNCNNGTMTPNCTVCVCNAGYGGESCEIDINECEPEPCFNNATCIDQINGYTCNCTNKWNGDNCTTCPLNCNNGTMTPNCTICVCNAGYEGESCEIDINECEPDPCFNNATCIDQINGYTCNCTNGWEGDNCFIPINPCAPNPCSQGGTCVQNGTSFVCICPLGYSGHTCNVASSTCNASESDTCNRGVCVEAPTFDLIEAIPPSYCECSASYTGSTCDRLINRCTSEACQNGGSCELVKNIEYNLNYTCTCPTPWSGPNCQLCPLDGMCENNGVRSADCSRCVCQSPYTGMYCTETSCTVDQVVDVNKCADECSTPSYQVSNGNICTACGIENCLQCNKDENVCTECQNGYQVIEKECARVQQGCGIDNCARCYFGICTICIANYSVTFENDCRLNESPIDITINSSFDSLPIIIGSVVGAIALIVILLLILIGGAIAIYNYYYKRNNLVYEVKKDDFKMDLEVENPLYIGGSGLDRSSQQDLIKSLEIV